MPSDAALITAVCDGDSAAYGALYERHLAAARRAAAGLVSTRAEREDLVAEAFTRVLRALRAGHGPTEAFRPYLITTMRHAVITSYRRRADVSLCAEVPEAPAAGGVDQVGGGVHATVAAEAFASLPERWRMVLWHTEIEGESPAEVAPLLGLTPNGVAALAYRAREGLREAYLRQFLPKVTRRDCRKVTGLLAGWIRHGFTPRTIRKITAHLDRCASCRELAAHLRQINGELRATAAPAILGIPLALAQVSASATTIATTASWLTVVKTVIVGATITATTAVATVSSEPGPDPGIATIAATVPAPPRDTPDDPRPPTSHIPAETTTKSDKKAQHAARTKTEKKPKKPEKQTKAQKLQARGGLFKPD